ncbi:MULTISPECIES: ABC transporter ATP-binding protein [Pelosinus]|uniref:ABC transporter transmembrane region n=1 Tax=Pelosinus fermentans B4 TaxID=1149862 RepID=I9LAF4_9FIRM|nr:MULTISPECIES: ABC transporter ATP-binding protein [Pelosinus]EIW17379.1 ABC transporter transmembrane region [Pelosinus fermentans B4]EIW23438.1 ABC transporter related protein [Pelosinus fermentans A11]OAM96536.1 Xenobiotic-transporting ATPase [Pelosinus fermentans DSM 17108]SDR41141.1 ATP-binding cassette, subfamily B [Pelosinus fermentans]
MLKLFKFLKPYQISVATVLLFTFIETLGTLYVPTLTADIVNNGVTQGNIPYIIKTGVFMLLVAIFTAGTAVLNSRLSANISSGFARDIRKALFMKAQALSINDFHKIGTASMITRTTSDVTLIGQTTVMLMQMLLPAPVMAVAGLFLAFSKDKGIALIIVATMLIFLLIAALLGKKIIPLFKFIQIKMDNITRILREIIIGVRVIRAFNRENHEKNKIDTAVTDYAANSIRINKMIATLLPVVMLVINMGIISILWLGGRRVADGQMQVGDIMALIEYCSLILFFLIMGTMMFMYIPRAQACAERIDEVLSMTPEITDKSSNSHPRGDYAHIEFRNVSFRYSNAAEPILSNLSFESKSGEVTAIIGGTGSGKSTIANLIPRFFEIESGSILINGTNIRNFSQKELRDKIGFVPQKAFLFSGTIADNIRDGKANATQAEIEQAAQIAQADGFIRELKNGYQAYVAQGGNNLSGGQKQRLTIARALIRKPEIYIFDDSFSALDLKTDAMLRRALKKEIGRATVIMVAQRISTIMEADRILVLEDGIITGTGQHQELMQNCQVYRQIAASQLSEAELASS